MHPTTLCAANKYFSADYPGRICNKIETDSNNTIEPVFVVGAAGDLNPITTCGTDFEELEKNKHPIYAQTGTYKHTTKIGNFLGQQALDLAKSIPDSEYFDGFQFKAYTKKIWMPFEDKQPLVYDWFNWISNKVVIFVKKYILFPIAMRHPVREPLNFPGLAIKHYPFSLKDGYNITVYTTLHHVDIKLSDSKNPKHTRDYAIMGAPGELFEDLEKKLQDMSPAGKENSMIIQNADDWCAYLFPISEYITQAGYEPFASTTPIAGYRFMKEYKLLLEEIKEGIQLGFN